MDFPLKPGAAPPPLPVLETVLPGPDRKKSETGYRYQLIYHNPEEAPGCRSIWQVTGGRLIYQVVLERTSKNTLQLHCSCADAIFRAEEEGRFCKHIRGLLRFGVSSDETLSQLEPRVRRRA